MGPVSHEQLPDDTGDNEKDETFQENWRFREDSFNTFASTSLVSKIGLNDLTLIIFSHKRLLVK